MNDVKSAEALTIGRLPERDEDLELAARHRYGDEEAFEEVFHRFRALVFGLSFKLCGNHELAADLSQDVFLRIHRHLGNFKGQASLNTWVYRVTLNCVRSHLRKKALPAIGLLEEGDERGVQLLDPVRSPEDLAVARSEQRRVRAAIARLPRRFAEAVILRDLGRLRYEEVAQVLSIPVGTVRSRLARGRLRLHKLLQVKP